jgi:hypothetical protein
MDTQGCTGGTSTAPYFFGKDRRTGKPLPTYNCDSEGWNEATLSPWQSACCQPVVITAVPRKDSDEDYVALDDNLKHLFTD